MKPLFCAARGDQLVVRIDPRRRVEIDDPDGRVRDLLALLAEGTRGTGALASELGLLEHEIRAAVGDLDDLGWLEDAAARPVLDAGLRERHHSNLAFLDGFSSLDRSSASMQERVLGAHVAVLGVGGLGAGVVQHLAGLGVGRLTLLDFDLVETRNFARQFTYTPAQLGLPKVEQVAASPRDRAVARWYVWLYAAGMLLAAWFFAAYFLPATIRLVRWAVAAMAAADPGRAAFWQAVGLSLVLLAPQLLTLWVAGRDLLRKTRRRSQARADIDSVCRSGDTFVCGTCPADRRARGRAGGDVGRLRARWPASPSSC